MEATVIKPTKPAKTAVSNLTLGNADDALALATELQRFVKANGLTSNIQGKAFPQVEAWMFAGSLLGLSSMLETIDDKSTADEIKWCAMVSIINTRTGAVVGRGFATCSNKEHSKRAFADYAICSMAQTRAVGKAYRLSLGWLMKAAGYEATPAEEMQDVGTVAVIESASEDNQPASPIQKEQIVQLINHPVITQPERSKMLLHIHKLDKWRANDSIAKLRAAIGERTELGQAAA